MSDARLLEREVQALRERISRLIDAHQRINESLDLETVLQGALDSARAMTGARYGVIVVLDDEGQIERFLSSGMSAEDDEWLTDVPGGLEIFRYLTEMSEPTRLTDFQGHMRSQGWHGFNPTMPVREQLSFLGAPIEHRDEGIGGIFLGEKEEEGDFSEEDEETLVLFASQAALVISNARRHQEEQRARNQLEALFDTSPVGIVVFDARTGLPVSLNREATRIMDQLLVQDQRPEHLVRSMTIRRADGREFSLADYPMAQALSEGETVRAEEVVLSVPDGRSTTVLVNGTPMRGADGEIESYVTALQDTTPLREMERLRAEFLGMVSHELRSPLATVKGSVTNLLDPSTSLNPTEVREFLQIIDTQTDQMRALISDLLDVARIETGALSVIPEPTDVAAIVDDAKRVYASTGGAHQLEINLPPDLPWVMADRTRATQVLTNLFANAARHSPEASPIEVGAKRDGLDIVVWVSDRGRGIPAERLPHLFRKFSHVYADDHTSDTGLGLAICKGIVEAHGGRIWAESEGPGLGARFSFTVPTVEGTGFVSPTPRLAQTVRQADRVALRILAVDDDPQALRLVMEALSSSGYQGIGASDAEEARRWIALEPPDLMLLDVMLPGVNGIELMQEIRRSYSVPVIFLSAYGQEELVARAFDHGAADYMVKPFSATELDARIRAALRRGGELESTPPYVLDELRIDYDARQVTLGERPVRLTSIEYRVLEELSRNSGRVVTHAQLLRRVWGGESDGDVRPMRTVISALRRRLGDHADNPKYIFTEPRVGYRMSRTEGDTSASATPDPPKGN